ncbi:MAG: phenylalanine 4-monooxygenase [Acidimicrobiales bacterium]
MYELPEDHPGFSDPEYRARRAAIGEVGETYQPGEPIPEVEYIEEEDDVWRVVSSELAVKHRKYACRDYLEGAEALDLRRDRVPQLQQVSEKLQALTRFGIRPVPGLVPTKIFYGSLADRRFMSTQYIRHHSVPFYTPEPDVIHELVGHCNSLGNQRFADLYEVAGQACRRVAESEDAVDFFSRVWWFTLEFGVIWEDGEPKTYGAGLLSSYGEIEEFHKADLRPWDIAAMGVHDYDITKYQPLLFAAESMNQVFDELTKFFTEFDLDSHDRWRQQATSAS